MKYFVLGILLISFFTQKVNAQIVWTPESAKWTYHGPGQYNSYIEITYDKDSLVLGKDSKVLKKTEYIFQEYQYDVVPSELGYEITYAEDSVVYLWRNNKFDTLYSFNSNIGNSWVLNCPEQDEYLCERNGKITVLDTGSLKINNIDTKFLVLEFNYDTLFHMGINVPYILTDTVFERIGSTELYFDPWDIINQMLDWHEGGKLRCYYEYDLGLYKNDFDNSCDFLVSVTDKRNTDFRFYPNPTFDNLMLEFNYEAKRFIEVYDLIGKKFISNKVNSNFYVLNLDIVPSGIFYLRVTENDKVVIKEFVKY